MILSEKCVHFSDHALTATPFPSKGSKDRIANSGGDRGPHRLHCQSGGELADRHDVQVGRLIRCRQGEHDVAVANGMKRLNDPQAPMTAGSLVPGLSRVKMLAMNARSIGRRLWVRKNSMPSRRLARVGESLPVHTKASSASRPTRCRAACANAAAREAPDDRP